MTINMSDPRLQRDLQRNRAKRSMGAGRGTLRSSIGRIVGRHAQYQQGMRQSFRAAADQQKSRKLSHKTALAGLAHSGRMLGLREDALADQKKMLPYHVGGKLLSAIGAGYEGYRRRKDLEASNALKEKRHQEIMAMLGESKSTKRSSAGHGTGIYGFKATEEEQ